MNQGNHLLFPVSSCVHCSLKEWSSMSHLCAKYCFNTWNKKLKKTWSPPLEGLQSRWGDRQTCVWHGLCQAKAEGTGVGDVWQLVESGLKRLPGVGDIWSGFWRMNKSNIDEKRGREKRDILGRGNKIHRSQGDKHHDFSGICKLRLQ